jgi:hypothetical protein
VAPAPAGGSAARSSPIHPGCLPTLARRAFVNFANIRGNCALNLLLDGRYDIFHASHHLVNPPRKPKLTATIFDMTCWLMPEMHTPRNVAATRRYAELILRCVDGMIAISESTRNGAVRILGLREEAVQVIYPGVAEAFFRVADSARERVREKYCMRRHAPTRREWHPPLVGAWLKRWQRVSVWDSFRLCLRATARLMLLRQNPQL